MHGIDHTRGGRGGGKPGAWIESNFDHDAVGAKDPNATVANRHCRGRGRVAFGWQWDLVQHRGIPCVPGETMTHSSEVNVSTERVLYQSRKSQAEEEQTNR